MSKDVTPNLCPNGHDKNVVGVRANGNGCNECKREAARKYREARKAGIPIDAKKSHARTDLGKPEVGA